MSGDDIRANIQFIIEQQAQFAVNMQKLEEAQMRQERASESSDRRLLRLEDAFVQLVELARSADDQLDDLRKAQVHTESKLAELAEAQKVASERITELAKVASERITELAKV